MVRRDTLTGLDDTIAAVSTAPGRSGRAIVRLSGRRAFDITRKAVEGTAGTVPSRCEGGMVPASNGTPFSKSPPLEKTDSAGKSPPLEKGDSGGFPASKSPPLPKGDSGGFPRTGYSSLECRIPIGDGAVPCVLYLMPAPRSYTREDVAEIHTFGAPPLAGAVLDRFMELGARPAEPGEFTKRAFINGRIDLTQAEAVLGVIRSRSAAEQQAAQRALAGELSEGIADVRERLEELCVRAEASMDFADQDMEMITPSGLAAELRSILGDLPGPDTAREKIHEAGVITVITGRTNVGKSTLFNTLCGRNCALVSGVSGTTRDWLSAEIEIDGITFVLIDTAGEWSSTGQIDRLARDATHRQVSSAQITVLVVDASAPNGIARDAQEIRGEDKRCGTTLLVLNRIDLLPDVDLSEISRLVPEAETAAVSALTGDGIDRLKKKLVDMVTSGSVPGGASHAALSARQRRDIIEAREAIDRGAAACRLGLDLAASDIRDALTALGSVLGWGAGDEILDAVFRDFCVGK